MALIHDWGTFSDTLHRALSRFPADEPRLAEAWKHYEEFRNCIRRLSKCVCHSWYAQVLFPKWDHEASDVLVMEKFGVLFDELEASGPDGMAASRDLWAFLRGGRIEMSARGRDRSVGGLDNSRRGGGRPASPFLA